jgi:Domain of unknown function (DUF4350)
MTATATDWKSILRRYWLVITAGIIILALSIFLSGSGSSSSTILQGSTYNLGPNGYSAWYQKIVDSGVKIERWRKDPKTISKTHPTGTTLLHILPDTNIVTSSNIYSQQLQNWVKDGNTLIILGYKATTQDIEFSQELDSPQGKVRIDTTRRWRNQNTVINRYLHNTRPEPIVQDKHGMVVFQSTQGQGKVIMAATPYLAANAYQDVGANLELLTTLATQDGNRLVVDEYSHGYKDPTADSSPATANTKDPWSYLANTPWAIVGLNLALLTVILFWQQNRRFGVVVTPKAPTVENSTAYIQALANILQQAKRSDFVHQQIGPQEQRHLQQKLGLGNAQLLDRQTIINALASHPHLSVEDLPDGLQLASDKTMTNAQLGQWLKQLQALRAKLASISS